MADDLAHALVDHVLEVIENPVDVVVDDQPADEDDQHHRALQLMRVQNEQDFHDDQGVLVDVLRLILPTRMI